MLYPAHAAFRLVVPYGAMVWTIAAPENRPRIVTALATAAIQALLVWMLATGFTVSIPGAIESGLATFDVRPPPPHERAPPPPPRHSTAAKGSPSPRNLRSRATPVAAPRPLIPLPPPPPIAVAPKPDTGAQATTGASDVAGPGTGAGGQGNGHGGGGNGDGAGPRWRKGEVKDSDYPRDAARAGVSGTVDVRYLVDASGRVTQCEVTHSSGSAALDETTCRLILKRFRYFPARDGYGRPVPAWVEESHSWDIVNDPAPPPPPGDDRGG